MRLLIDTHAILWFITADPLLSGEALRLISDENNICYVSIASIWELGIKASRGRLDIGIDFPEIIKLIDYSGFITLPIRSADIREVAMLPFYHGDPFDRMIISQAIANNIKIVTKDTQFSNYKINCIW
jgi:PIN domain nuclease of toxin-antitoxin system